jgi:hypothetical protein
MPQARKHELLEQAKRLTKRQPDGGFREEDLVRTLASLITDEEMRLEIATEMLARLRQAQFCPRA